MRFAILGDHPDGWAVARALVASGRHQLTVYQGATPPAVAQSVSPEIRGQNDIEEILADPAVDAVIVAVGLDTRLDVLRRVLQSERSALCVHPVDRKPDGGHEINLLQGDLHQVVVPILPDAVYPEIADMSRALTRVDGARPACLLDVQIADRGALLFESDRPEEGAYFPGWTLLRRLGGEIAEVEAFAAAEEIERTEPVLAQGRFITDGLFRVLYRPRATHPKYRINLISPEGERALDLSQAQSSEHLWTSIAQVFERAVTALPNLPRPAPGAGRPVSDPNQLNWLDEVRCLELDDAARRSVARRRAMTLDYQEATEEVGFKGTMTLVGCGMLWVILLLLLLSAWFPAAGWFIVPVLIIFLGLQLLRWLPASSPSAKDP